MRDVPVRHGGGLNIICEFLINADWPAFFRCLSIIRQRSGRDANKETEDASRARRKRYLRCRNQLYVLRALSQSCEKNILKSTE
jgi:hypothetical protein